MKIKLIKEGGFIGIPANKSVDLSDLSDDERKAFNDAVENPPKCDNETTAQGMQSRDVISYEIKMRKGSKTVSLKYDDTTIPEIIYLMFQNHL